MLVVAGVDALGAAADYDRVHELANEHKTLRQMLGHSGGTEEERDRDQLQTIKDNLRLFTPDPVKRAAKQEAMCQAYRDYLTYAENLLVRVRESRFFLDVGQVPAPLLAPIDLYLSDAERQIDQIRRRVLQGETIPHEEKRPWPP